MSSQLNVDTIVDKAGSGGTNVKVANTSTYVSDGGNVTQNTVQGLCKHWISVDMSNATALDSFNAGSITDNGTGDFTNTITSAMSNDDYSNTIGSLYVAAWGQIAFFRTNTARSTTVYRTGSVNYHTNGNATDSPQFDTQVNGDLA